MKLIALVLTLFLLTSCRQDTGALDQRVAFWNQSLSEVPVGSSSEQVKQWADRHDVKFIYMEEQHQFYANVERVPVKGIRFPCGEWNIIIKITIDASGHTIKNEIGQVGTCV